MDFLEYLNQEWVPALGCTEPASIAYAGATAAMSLRGAEGDVAIPRITKVKLTVDPRIYKNCYAVGIPHSNHKTGIKWAAAIGCNLKNSLSRLECFKHIDKDVLKKAEKLINSGNIKIEIDRSKTGLYIDFEASSEKNSARCVIENKHTNIVKIEKNGKEIASSASGGLAMTDNLSSRVASSLSLRVVEGNEAIPQSAREWAASLDISEILKIVMNLDDKCRKKIKDGAKLNIDICKHGLKLFPKPFIEMNSHDPLSKIATLVCAGVYARMWGEDFPVMSVSGSGNKGITCTVPLLMLQDEWKFGGNKLEEALALAMIYTSKTTEELGTLSAVCGCSNAAGIGLSCALIYLRGGGEKEISFAINNMVGNVTGMICDGAKIGCALKTMTAVDAAFRASSLAMNGIGIPVEDGIVGKTGGESLSNMGKIAKDGMIHTDSEILKIMEEKL